MPPRRRLPEREDETTTVEVDSVATPSATAARGTWWLTPLLVVLAVFGFALFSLYMFEAESAAERSAGGRGHVVRPPLRVGDVV